MKVTAWFDTGKNPTFKIRLDSENQQESAEIHEAIIKAKSPVAAYGRVEKAGTWGWFFIPISEKRNTRFDNGVEP